MSKTPCDKLGYSVGQAFKVISDQTQFSVADIVYLHRDDGSTQPEFRDTEDVEDGMDTDFIHLSHVAPYIPGLSPAQALGYKEGDVFISQVDDGTISEDELIVLERDDGSVCPKFRAYDNDSKQEYLYLGDIKPLAPEVGRKARVLRNLSRGHTEGTEGIITGVNADGIYINANGYNYVHEPETVLTFALSDSEDTTSEEEDEEDTNWEITSHDKWKQGDIAIIRLNPDGYHNFDIYELVTFVEKQSDKSGHFVNSSKTYQSIFYRDVERIPNSEKSTRVELLIEEDKNPVAIIKAIRRLTGWGLKESKDFYDEARRDGIWRTIGTYHKKDAWVFFAMVDDAGQMVSLDDIDIEEASFPVSSEMGWPTKPSHEWKAGDLGIVRGQQQENHHFFTLGDTLTFVRHAAGDVKAGIFKGNSLDRTQCVEFAMVEPLPTITSATLTEAAQQILGEEMASSKPRQVLYYQDGDSKEMSLIGYFQNKPVLGYIDRWDDPQVFIGKESLITEID